MTDISKCEICGKEMTVVGNTTKHYECLECNKERENIYTLMVNELNNYFGVDERDDGVGEFSNMVVNYILKKEQEYKVKYFMGCDECDLKREGVDKRWYCSPEEDIRADERRKVIKELRAELFGDMKGCLYTPDGIIVKNALNKIEGQLNDKKVDR